MADKRKPRRREEQVRSREDAEEAWLDSDEPRREKLRKREHKD